MNSKDVAVILIMICSFATALAFPLVRAWSRRIDSRHGGDHLADDVAELRDRVAELEAASAHVAELEERLDFAERLLAKGDVVRERLPGA
ncbi:MAG TPA: hypothetical protein VHW65_05745 [Gemmatimonadales bacterium]|nr:hypothetical protein [Gemmatimonadales bacterium]